MDHFHGKLLNMLNYQRVSIHMRYRSSYAPHHATTPLTCLRSTNVYNTMFLIS